MTYVYFLDELGNWQMKCSNGNIAMCRTMSHFHFFGVEGGGGERGID